MWFQWKTEQNALVHPTRSVVTNLHHQHPKCTIASIECISAQSMETIAADCTSWTTWAHKWPAIRWMTIDQTNLIDWVDRSTDCNSSVERLLNLSSKWVNQVEMELIKGFGQKDPHPPQYPKSRPRDLISQIIKQKSAARLFLSIFQNQTHFPKSTVFHWKKAKLTP